ncbi:MAG: hypothetical protein JW769_03805 [Parachlamydiales bacterium]|nr:hypothetical protein [Parachlamydiales bacterium]
MESYLTSSHLDLISPDGQIENIIVANEKEREIEIKIDDISPTFQGFFIDKTLVHFNLKSTLAQSGLNTKNERIELDRSHRKALVRVTLYALSPIGETLIELIEPGSYIGKLFAADDRRRVREPYYLERMLGRIDRYGDPLLSFGTPDQRDTLILEKKGNTTLAFIPTKKGIVTYSDTIVHFLPTLAQMLKHPNFSTRQLLQLHQIWNPNYPCKIQKNDLLLTKTAPLHVRTVFARVSSDYLPKGFHHTSADVLQPDTKASGDIYEFYGKSSLELEKIPLEFYTLEPHREHVFFEDRDQLQECLEKPDTLFKAFTTAPLPQDLLSAAFIVKGTQLTTLQENDWITRKPTKHPFPGIVHPSKQAFYVEKYITAQPSYPFLKAIDNNQITSQGVLLTRYFPSPLMKRMILNDIVAKNLKGIYFQHPSLSHDYYFSHEDRSFLFDLAKFGIPVFWVDEVSKNILQYIVKPDKDSGMFVPLDKIETFRSAIFFGVYGSNLFSSFEKELKQLLLGLKEMQDSSHHPLFNAQTPLALITGGGPGAMELGNKVAKEVGFLSCANFVDFRPKDGSVINEQKHNPYVDAKMTYRIDKLIERQAEFHLDFPICLPGGIGMDFEFTLEEVRRKTGGSAPTPILLFGTYDYWKEKITSRFQCNRKNKTIAGSEWVSNCFYVVQTKEHALWVYKKFFEGSLHIGKNGPIYDEGFCHVALESIS